MILTPLISQLMGIEHCKIIHVNECACSSKCISWIRSLRSRGWLLKKSLGTAVLCVAWCSLSATNLFKICFGSKAKTYHLHPAELYLQSSSLVQKKSDIRVVASFQGSLVQQYGEADLLLVNLSYAYATLTTSVWTDYKTHFSFLMCFLTT